MAFTQHHIADLSLLVTTNERQSAQEELSRLEQSTVLYSKVT